MDECIKHVASPSKIGFSFIKQLDFDTFRIDLCDNLSFLSSTAFCKVRIIFGLIARSPGNSPCLFRIVGFALLSNNSSIIFLFSSRVP